MHQLMREEANIKTYGEIALQYAAYRGYFEADQFLVLSGIDVDGLTALQSAVSGGKIWPVEILLDANSDVNATHPLRQRITILKICG